MEPRLLWLYGLPAFSSDSGVVCREFHTDAAASRHFGSQRRSTSSTERVEYDASFWNDGHKRQHELQRLACRVQFLQSPHGIREYAGQAVTRHIFFCTTPQSFGKVKLWHYTQ